MSGRSQNWPSKVTDSRSDQEVMTALQTQRQQHHYRMQLPVSTPRVGEWLDSFAAKTEKKQTTSSKNKCARNGKMMGGIKDDAMSGVKDSRLLPAPE